MIHTGRVLRLVRSTPWSILPDKLEEIVAIVEDHAAGVRLTHEEIRARIGSAPRPEPSMAGSVAVLPLRGVVAQRANVMTEISGGTSTERLGAMLAEYVRDPEISAVVLDVDSPGGSVFGVPELAASIMRMRGRKPIVAVANSLAASAAYWIGAAADQFYVTPGGLVGSIGVLSVHTDISKAEEAAGTKTTIVTSAKYKAEGNEYEPLTEEARAQMQARVDAYHAMFVRDVAAGRGVSAQVVQDTYGQGRVVNAEEAVRLGMADKVATLDQVIARLQRQPASRSARAFDVPAEIAAEEPAATPKTVTALDLRIRQWQAMTHGPSATGSEPAQERN